MADLHVCSHGNTKPCDECGVLYGSGRLYEKPDDYRATCRGSLALGTGCGKCSRCKAEQGESYLVRVADDNYRAGLKHGSETMNNAIQFEWRYWNKYGGAGEPGARLAVIAVENIAKRLGVELK